MRKIKRLYWLYQLLNVIVCFSAILSMFGAWTLCVDHYKYATYILLLFTVFICPCYFILLKIIGQKCFRIEQLLQK